MIPPPPQLLASPPPRAAVACCTSISSERCVTLEPKDATGRDVEAGTVARRVARAAGVADTAGAAGDAVMRGPRTPVRRPSRITAGGVVGGCAAAGGLKDEGWSGTDPERAGADDWPRAAGGCASTVGGAVSVVSLTVAVSTPSDVGSGVLDAATGSAGTAPASNGGVIWPGDAAGGSDSDGADAGGYLAPFTSVDAIDWSPEMTCDPKWPTDSMW